MVDVSLGDRLAQDRCPRGQEASRSQGIYLTTGDGAHQTERI